jgi:hypothetical protein
MPYFRNYWSENTNVPSCECMDCGKIMPLMESMSHQCDPDDKENRAYKPMCVVDGNGRMTWEREE